MPPGPSEDALPPGQRPTGTWRASHYGRVPRLDPDSWTLTLAGETRDGGMRVLTWEDLGALPQVEVVAGMHCVDRHTVPGLRWGGVRMRDVLALAPPARGVEHVLLAATRGYAAAVHLEDLRHPDALLAHSVGGEPLTPEHGWPARVVLPHLYGFKGPKWVVEVTYHDRPQQGWWESHGYHPRGRVAHEERWAHQA
ncbi:molybdopterin-dependent oxidoreductase [Serinicoccus kebangsaanensis]|uniref:molybdopterin-dependent oxidoreductase n=1 Tax=Serinicoccus kebangsaanensis TaxID=2602069 RepID=UPI00124E6348|nr:molybdopterin-dependent oxidoreductase [Serinicoccus kebangsaanensis]